MRGSCPARPADLHVHSTRVELDRRTRVVKVRLRIRAGVARDRQHRSEAPRPAVDRHVVRRGDKHATAEVRLVGQLAQRGGKPRLRRREREIDDVVALAHRPAQAGHERLAAPGEVRAEDAYARQLARRRERAHDPGARRSVPGDVADLVGLDAETLIPAARRRPRARAGRREPDGRRRRQSRRSRRAPRRRDRRRMPTRGPASEASRTAASPERPASSHHAGSSSKITSRAPRPGAACPARGRTPLPPFGRITRGDCSLAPGLTLGAGL